jgi:hypothetical protein
MKHFRSALFSLLGLLALAPLVHAQAVYTADRKSSIEVGGGINYIQPDYAAKSIIGASFWGDYNFTRLIGVQAEANLGTIITPTDIQQISFLVGPRVSYHRNKFTVSGKFMFGIGNITNNPADIPNFAANSNNNPFGVLAFGGGVEYRVARKIAIRPIEIEVQKWGNFEPHTLSPMVYTFGVSYMLR